MIFQKLFKRHRIANDPVLELQIFTELLDSENSPGWLGFKKMLDSNVIATRMS